MEERGRRMEEMGGEKGGGGRSILSHFFSFTPGLLIARNHLACYHGNHSGHVTMPGMLRERHTCKHCPQLPQCMLYHKLVMCQATIHLELLYTHEYTPSMYITPSHPHSQSTGVWYD